MPPEAIRAPQHEAHVQKKTREFGEKRQETNRQEKKPSLQPPAQAAFSRARDASRAPVLRPANLRGFGALRLALLCSSNVENKRKSLTPGSDEPPPVDGETAAHPMRRGGARRVVTERVALRGTDGVLLEGWALNVSRGGVRCILEQKVPLGGEFDVLIGEEGNAPLTRRGRVVWVQEEADGCVVGLEFLNLSGAQRAVPEDPR